MKFEVTSASEFGRDRHFLSALRICSAVQYVQCHFEGPRGPTDKASVSEDCGFKSRRGSDQIEVSHVMPPKTAWSVSIPYTVSLVPFYVAFYVLAVAL